MLIVLVLIGIVFFFFYNKENRNAKKLEIKENQNAEKGSEFEETVAQEVNRLLPEAKILRNLIIPNGKKGGTTEIDVLVLTTKGFYCLECKNYSGFVVGNIEDKMWTIFYGKNFKKTFYSPLQQNIRHIECLRAMFPKNYFFNIVLFSDNTRLSKNLFANKDIMRFSSFVNYVANIIPKKEVKDTNSEVESIYDYLKQYENKNRESHIEYVKKMNSKVVNF